jgi:hypothetical protein
LPPLTAAADGNQLHSWLEFLQLMQIVQADYPTVRYLH